MAARLSIQPMTSSLNFSATTHKVDCGTDFIGTGNVTFCGWIKPRSSGGGGGGRIIDNGRFTVQVNNNKAVILKSDNATTAGSANSAYNLNTWVFVSITRTSAGVANFRINGATSGTANQISGTPATATTNATIGNLSGGTRQFDGELKNIQVYNRILTAEEQDNIYYAGAQPSDYVTSIVRDFRLEEGSGATVTSTTGETGTITGATWSTDTPKRARTPATSRTTATNRVAVRDMGTALSFSAGRVEANALDLSIGQPCTVAIWLTPAQLQQYAVLFANLKDASNKLYIGIRNTSNKIEGSWHNGASYFSGFRTNTLTGLSPVFFVLVYNGSTSFPYINGVYNSNGSSNIGTGGVVGKLSIGSLDGALGNPFKGIIDEPRIWNRALTATEIQNLYLHNIVPRDGLVAEYLFNEASGTTALDTSGNGNDGTITGATYTLDVPLKPRTAV